jgi:hypothetical protein
MVALCLAWASRALVAMGVLLGIAAVIQPLRLPGAMSLGFALLAAAALLKVLKEYLLATPVPLNLLNPLWPYKKPILEKHQEPVRYALPFLFLLVIFGFMFVILLMSAIKAFRAA